MEQYKRANRELKSQLRQQSGRSKSRTRQASRSGVRSDQKELKRLQSVIERLQRDAEFQRLTNGDLKLKMQEMHTRSTRMGFDKKYESERAKNTFLENENMRLQSQIREQSVKYKLQLDERNRSTINDYMRKRTTSGTHADDQRLASENRNLRERLNSLSNELKMNKNISDAVVLKQEQVDALGKRVAQLEHENKILTEKADSLETHAKTLKETLSMRDSESATVKQSQDHMVKMYQRLYNDMKRQCEIYINKVEEMRVKMQTQAMGGNAHSYTKKVFQSRSRPCNPRRPAGRTRAPVEWLRGAERRTSGAERAGPECVQLGPAARGSNELDKWASRRV